MIKAFVFLILSLTPTLTFTQDVGLRSRAVSLLERAHAVSMAPNLPNLERVDTFQVFDPGATAREGTFTRVVIQGNGRREETTFGDYHFTQVWAGTTLASTGTPRIAPPEVVTVMRLTPIHLVGFNDADVIRSIDDRQAAGHLLRCVAFETIVGQTHEENELCFDAANGTLVTEKLGDELIENSDFFTFAGVLLPGKNQLLIVGQQEIGNHAAHELVTGHRHERARGSSRRGGS